jgi:intracellular multiplication protein IcmJ
MLKLKLSVNPGAWSRFSARRDHPKFKKIAKKVFARDGATCRYCEFQASTYMDVVNYDQNYSNNKPSNLITACCFCSQCLFLESVGMDGRSGGQLIYLPEMSQAELNSFCHVLFCAQSEQSNFQDSAQSIYRAIKFRHQVIESTFGPGSSDPGVMANLIIEHNAMHNTKVESVLLKDLRLLPIHSKFAVQLTAWAQTALNELAD